VSERFKEHAWKACVGETRPWVRIPPSPPYFRQTNPVVLFTSVRQNATFFVAFGEPGKALPVSPGPSSCSTARSDLARRFSLRIKIFLRGHTLASVSPTCRYRARGLSPGTPLTSLIRFGIVSATVLPEAAVWSWVACDGASPARTHRRALEGSLRHTAVP
jgi:hypothetical protein